MEMMETPFIEVAWWNVVDWGITCRERYLTTVILPSFFCCWRRRRRRILNHLHHISGLHAAVAEDNRVWSSGHRKSKGVGTHNACSLIMRGRGRSRVAMMVMVMVIMAMKMNMMIKMTMRMTMNVQLGEERQRIYTMP